MYSVSYFKFKIMNERQKAKELISKANRIIGSEQFKNESKEIALLCVDECIKEHCHESEHKDPLAQDRWIDYWQQVRKEISLL